MVEAKTAFLVVMVISGVTVAVQSIMCHDGGLMYYYSGFDPAWYDYSPLTILSRVIIEDAIKHKMVGIEFLFTPALWKQRWGIKRTSWIVTETHFGGSFPSWMRLAWTGAGRLFQR